jgi:6-phosphogluconolactonase (cycloisomerase 2 family)
MRSKRTKAILATAFLLALAAGALVGCSSGQLDAILGGGNLNFPTTPKFLVAIDGGAGNNVNVFPVNATTAVLGAQVSGAPFDMGLTNATIIATHPNGHWLYVGDAADGTIHALDINQTTGVPTVIGAVVSNESGSFFEGTGEPTRSITVTPDGKFLYASNDDAMVSEYTINQSTGALTHIGDLDVGAIETGAITSTNSFVWVADTDPNSITFPGDCPHGPGDATPEHVQVMSIGSSGALTKTSTATFTNVYCWLWSISVSPDGKFLQVGDEGGDAQIYSFTVAADGSLTMVGTQLVENASSDCRDIAYSPDGKFIYTTDDEDTGMHALAQNPDGSLTEVVGSPFSNSSASSGDGNAVVSRNGAIVFGGGDSQVVSYTRNSSTGALTLVTNTDTNFGNPIAIGLVYVQ